MAQEEQKGPGFVSPFSATKGYTLRWTQVPLYFRGKENFLESLTERDISLLKAVGQVQIATGGQLGKAFWKQPKQNSDRLKVLSQAGILTKHRIECRAIAFPLYTLGPLGAKLLDQPFVQWWLETDISRILALLISSQLFFRMRIIAETNYFPAPPPLTAVMRIGGTEYAVLAARNLNLEFDKAMAPRLFVIGESKKHLLAMASQLKSPARFTTDERLFTLPLEQVFMRYNPGTGNLEEELIQFTRPLIEFPDEPDEEEHENLLVECHTLLP
ncbi:MAG: hypothetical protein ACYCX4_01445 [Bacillota bacterium]